MAAATLPILLTKPQILVIGGGSTALLKVRGLIKNGLRCSLVASRICAELRELDLEMSERPFSSTDLAGKNLVVDASGDANLAASILAQKTHYNFLFNCCARQELSDFHLSSLLNYGHLKIAISTDGASPTIGKLVRDKIAATIPAELESLVNLKKLARDNGIIDPQGTKVQCREVLTNVSLIGCGPGDAELLTLKAYKRIQQAQVVLYDHLLTQEILDLIPEKAERICVGKLKGCHSYKQEEINELLYQKALLGVNVARMKCGDPYIFGRGAEEAEYLIERGIRVEVINGISSALAGPASAGIPPTARGYATNMSIVSAHLAGSRINSDWFPLLKIPHHTTVVLMGLSFAKEISELALAQGVPASLPVAIISNATRPNQTALVTDLEQLPVVAEQAERPAILVMGDVVNLHNVLAQPQEVLYRMAQ